MKETPLLFSGEMVRAILDGRKSQTRRICKGVEDRLTDYSETREIMEPHWIDKSGSCPVRCNLHLIKHRCPHGGPGDRCWVKETFLNNALEGYPPVYLYRADGDDKPDDRKWKPSIFMPRDASRITLEIVSVRVERVQDITEDDAKAEGISIPTWSGIAEGPVFQYQRLWDSLNGNKYPWKSNPFVFVLTFNHSETNSKI